MKSAENATGTEQFCERSQKEISKTLLAYTKTLAMKCEPGYRRSNSPNRCKRDSENSGVPPDEHENLFPRLTRKGLFLTAAQPPEMQHENTCAHASSRIQTSPGAWLRGRRFRS